MSQGKDKKAKAAYKKNFDNQCYSHVFIISRKLCRILQWKATFCVRTLNENIVGEKMHILSSYMMV